MTWWARLRDLKVALQSSPMIHAARLDANDADQRKLVIWPERVGGNVSVAAAGTVTRHAASL